MNQINFSHSYPKLWGQNRAELLAVRKLGAEEVWLNDELVEYDTHFNDERQEGYYDLPKKGDLIQLIFLGERHIPFCTLRRYTKAKYDYYLKCIGQIFEVDIDGN